MQVTGVPFQGQGERILSRVKAGCEVGMVGAACLAGILLLFVVIPAPTEATGGAYGAAWDIAAPLLAGGYLYLLTKAYRTRTQPVGVYADLRGLFLNGELVAPREQLRLAAIRLPQAGSRIDTGHGLLVMDAVPLSVELVTDEDAWNLIVGDLGQSEALLTAMGLPPSAIPAGHTRSYTRSEQAALRRMVIAMVGAMGLATLLGALKTLLHR